MTGEVAVRFGIGYADDDWQPLAKAFADYQDKALETAGLVIAGDNGKRYDRFRDRVMFPIHDGSGRVIGFGGRILDQGEPKYLNSPETPLFSKGRELYGLFQARPAIRTAGKVIVVEGYMDVVALAQHGVEYAVATLGTATTPIHAQKLLRMTDTVVFCFDGDEAGRRAAWRALENTLPVLTDGKTALFLFLPDGEDPDDYIRRRGKAAFEDLVSKALPLSDFLLSELATRHPPSSSEGRAALVTAGKPLLAQLTAPILSALLRKRLAEMAGLTANRNRESGTGAAGHPQGRAANIVTRGTVADPRTGAMSAARSRARPTRHRAQTHERRSGRRCAGGTGRILRARRCASEHRRGDAAFRRNAVGAVSGGGADGGCERGVFGGIAGGPAGRRSEALLAERQQARRDQYPGRRGGRPVAGGDRAGAPAQPGATARPGR